MKKNLLLLSLVCMQHVAKTQIIAGDSISSNISYSNITDITIGNTNYLDLDNDGNNDVKFWETQMYSGGSSYGDENILCLRNTVELIEHTNYIDTIQNNTLIDNTKIWATSVSGFYLQDYSSGLNTFHYGNFYGNNKYIGFRIITANDTLYGWILLNCVTGLVTIKSFAINKSNIGINYSINTNTQILIYPNPTSNQFIIEAISTGKKTIQVFDLNGGLVLNQIINNKTIIDATNLNEGVYNLTIKSNEEIINKKLVIVR